MPENLENCSVVTERLQITIKLLFITDNCLYKSFNNLIILKFTGFISTLSSITMFAKLNFSLYDNIFLFNYYKISFEKSVILVMQRTFRFCLFFVFLLFHHFAVKKNNSLPPICLLKLYFSF